MINRWTSNDGDAFPVLRTSPTASCSSRTHKRLCYGERDRRPDNAQFISCYNTAKLIPEFTAYVVPPGALKNKLKLKSKPQWTSKPKQFRQDKGPCAPDQQSEHEDISKPANARDPYFCSRGHLAPKGAFDTPEERSLTYIMTNVAPQWQAFNGGNWAAVENAVKNYAKHVGRGVYVFTGTAGKTKYWQHGWRKTLKTSPRGPVVPRYFWKAVCDPHPEVRQSIFFIAENNVNDQSKKVVRSPSCFGKAMRHDKGVIKCKSISEAATGIKAGVPDFDPVNCGTAEKGKFLKQYLNFKTKL